MKAETKRRIAQTVSWRLSLNLGRMLKHAPPVGAGSEGSIK